MAACDASKEPSQESAVKVQDSARGTLFIIGGGPRPPELMSALGELVDDEATVAVLTLASSEPDSAWWYINRDLQEAGLRSTWHFDVRNEISLQMVDSLRNSGLLFLSGGDQSAFLRRADTLNIIPAIHKAYQSGGVIAGTSAGAALMSEVMISGDQHFSEAYEPTYSRLMAQNAVYETGLGFLKNTIVDQHFVERSRYNRMLTALHDHPLMTVLGIGESTAAIVRGNEVQVTGAGQVVVASNRGAALHNAHGRIKLENVNFSVLVNGDRFLIEEKP
ncbi:MAG: hypothetical protein EA392_13010 [Cryomorphaceae bacterium]|nr:MAG: hypothetical protein EA392_13010 [Cryomorphaceae bacterium]